VGILLYPTTGPAPDEALVVDGHRLRLHTVNLAQGGGGVHRRLLGLYGESEKPRVKSRKS